MKHFYNILFFILLVSNGYSQNNIYVGTAKFDAGYTWTFEINGGWIQGDGEVTFGKRKGGGMLLVSVKDFNGNIKGDLFVYLKDGNVIQCIDRNIKDNVDHYSMAVYYLTTSEIEMLKDSDIDDIRFTINKYPLGPKSYTMSNQYSLYADDEIRTNSTAIDVLILMGK